MWRSKILEPIEVDRSETVEERFCESLDSAGEVNVCGLIFSRSNILREMDPVAYNVGLVDYESGQSLVQYECPVCGGEYDNYEDAKWCCQD